MTAAAAGGVRLLHEDAHLALVWKPSGVALSRRDAGRGPQRAGPPLEEWAAEGGVAASREPDACAPGAAHARLERAVGGLVALSKTQRAAHLLTTGSATARCEYAAVCRAGSSSPAGVRVERAPEPPGRLALVRVDADGAQRPLADVAASLAQRGWPVLGVHDESAARDSGAGGAHIALVGLVLPPSLASLRGAAVSSFSVAVPAKFSKAQRREALHAARLAQLTAEGDVALEEEVVSFCGVPLRVPRTQLRPRESSAPLVRAALDAAVPHAQPRLLDLGTGCGALLLAALAALPDGATGAGIDCDDGALRFARANADALLGADASARRVALLDADFGALHTPELRARLDARGYHAVMCNPPYLREHAASSRPTHEPARALFAGASGDDAYAAIAASLGSAQPPLLAPDGVLALQLPGGGGRDRVAALFVARGFAVAGELRDARGVVRCLLLRQHAVVP